MRVGPRLHRETFSTSRLLEFCSVKELTLQTGHPVEQGPLVVEKELFDNALEAAEEFGIARKITMGVTVPPDQASITITDNTAGIPAATVDKLLDFSAADEMRYLQYTVN